MGTSYQWQLNTGNDYINITDNINFAGTNTAVLNLFNIPSNWYGYSFRCIVNGTSGKVSTIKVVNTWTGAVNSSWENPANWSCGTVPDINTDVIISSGTVVINSNVVIRSLKLDADVLFTLKPTFTIILTH